MDMNTKINRLCLLSTSLLLSSSIWDYLTTFMFKLFSFIAIIYNEHVFFFPNKIEQFAFVFTKKEKD